MSARQIASPRPDYTPGSEYLGGVFGQMLPQEALPGKVTGVISLDPPTIQCGGCGLTYSHPRLHIAVCCSGIKFSPRAHLPNGDRDHRRLCPPCQRDADWPADR